MPAELASRWRAYYEIEPWDERITNAMLARVVDIRLTQLLCVLGKQSNWKDRLLDPDCLMPGWRPNDVGNR